MSPANGMLLAWFYSCCVVGCLTCGGMFVVGLMTDEQLFAVTSAVCLNISPHLFLSFFPASPFRPGARSGTTSTATGLFGQDDG
eukprot:COSAG01_NODE_18090_length_1101_cov_2.766467_3_plen_84_part_00